MAPTQMCDTCRTIPFHKLPSEEQDGVPHLPSYDDLENSAKSCPLCALLCWSVACSFRRVGGMAKFSPVQTLPSGKPYSSNWSGSMYSKMGMRAMENGAITLDFSAAKADLREPLTSDTRAFVPDGSLVRPWLFGNWYASPFKNRQPWLVGLGVRLGKSPRIEDAVGIVEERKGQLEIRFPGTFLRVRADDEAYIAPIVPGRLRADEQGSKIAFSRVKEWVKLCDQHHQCAVGHSCTTEPKSPILPTRVIDVRPNGTYRGDFVRLVEPRQIRDHYIALSHCWGTSDRLTTVKSNLEEHKQFIRLSALATTFQDAVVIARELEIQYVWIDSLCIVQDDFLDWQKEAARMGDVYSNAYLTIAALNAGDDAEGIFSDGARRLERPLVSCDTISTGRRCFPWAAPLVGCDTRDGEEVRYYRRNMLWGVCDNLQTSETCRVFVTPEWMPSSLKPAGDANREKSNDTSLYLVGEFGGAVDPFEEEPLSSRGWTLQERVLSRRTLHYGSDELIWECQAMVLAEDGALLQRSFLTREEVLESRTIEDPVEGGADSNGPAHRTRPGRDPWFRLVEEYCTRNLTRPEDKLPALAGLARSIAARSGDTYHAGVWRRDIIEGLNWEVEVIEPSHQCDDPEHDAALPPPSKSFPTFPEKYRAPSWSWASMDAKVKFSTLGRSELEDQHLAQCISVHTPPAGEDPFGMVAEGYIELKAALCIVREHQDKEESGRRVRQSVFTQSIELVSKQQGTRWGRATFDADIQLPCYAIILSSEAVLLLEPRKHKIFDPDQVPTFRRIGRAHFYSSSPHWGWKKDKSISDQTPVSMPSGTSSEERQASAGLPTPPQSPSIPSSNQSKNAKRRTLSETLKGLFLGKDKTSPKRDGAHVNTTGQPRQHEDPKLSPQAEQRLLQDMADGSMRVVHLY